MDQVITEGLHSCKPHNTPTVGQIKSFLVTTETSQRTGNQWTKIANKKPDEGGRWYRIVTVRQTDRGADRNNNISFNLEIEPADAPPQQQVAPQNHPPANANGAPAAPVQQQAIDTAEQFLMREANLYVAALRLSATVIRQAGNRLGVELSVEDLRQIATHLSMGAQYAGYISHMSDVETKSKNAPF